MKATDSRPERLAATAPATASSTPPAITPAPALVAGREPELAWLLFCLLCLVAIVVIPKWQVIPFDLIWISLAALYGFRFWPGRRTLAVIAATAVSTAAAVGDDVVRHFRAGQSIDQIPLLAAMFVALAWQAHRRLAAPDRVALTAEAERLLNAQRQFLQDASHQLRTPITIALGHAELLAGALAEGQQRRDIHVVVGELERLKCLSERLLLVAASQNPDFLQPAPVELERLAAELMRRWRPTSIRHWQLGQLDPVRVFADQERLGLALDALVENAVQHTDTGDDIRVSVVSDVDAPFARIVVEDSGEGIASADIPHIFDRFRTTTSGGQRGTGLGLALVQAIAEGHGGEVRVHSAKGKGSRFEVLLPAATEAVLARPALDQEVR